MNGQTLQHTVTLTNPLGFHMRPKEKFLKLASRFQSKVTLLWEGQAFNGKGMWDLMLVAAPKGSELTIEVDGPDAPAALDALVDLLRNIKDYTNDELAEPAPPGSLDS